MTPATATYRHRRPLVATTTLQVVVPVYHEQDNLPTLIAQIEQHLPSPRVVTIVYDSETDPTVPVARKLAASRTWLRLVHNDLGPGVISALKKGLATVTDGPCLVAMADGSDDLSVVPRMLELYEQGYRIVCASRYMRGGRQIGGPLVKRLMSRAAGISLRYLVRFPTHDATNNFRLYDAALVRELTIESEGGFELALELTAKAFRRGEPIAQVPTTWRDRTAGQSNFRLWKWLPRYLRWYRLALLG